MKGLRHPLFAAVVVALLAAPALAEPAAEWTIDRAHSEIAFSVRHIFTPVRGTFDRFHGTLRFDPENLEGSRVDVEIEIPSVNTRNGRRDAHLITPDFFDAERFPTMHFVGDTFVAQGENRYLIAGRLTIRDVTRNVALPFTLLGVRDHPMKPGHLVAGATARMTVSRTEYGVGSGSFAETAVVGDEVEIEIRLEASRPKE